MMAEAKKMMDDPSYQKRMKEMSKSKEFREGMKQSVEMLQDPAKAAAAEAKLEHMLKVGNDQIKQASRNVMDDAMAAMGNPEVMAEMARMVKDPQFQQQLGEMAKDPSFKNYIDAMQDMMKDPQKKRQMELIGEAMKANL
jgi:hypothetical protein